MYHNTVLGICLAAFLVCTAEVSLLSLFMNAEMANVETGYYTVMSNVLLLLGSMFLIETVLRPGPDKENVKMFNAFLFILMCGFGYACYSVVNMCMLCSCLEYTTPLYLITFAYFCVGLLMSPFVLWRMMKEFVRGYQLVDRNKME